MVGVIQPGGFVNLFAFLAQANYTSILDAPLPAVTDGASQGGSPDIIT